MYMNGAGIGMMIATTAQVRKLTRGVPIRALSLTASDAVATGASARKTAVRLTAATARRAADSTTVVSALFVQRSNLKTRQPRVNEAVGFASGLSKFNSFCHSELVSESQTIFSEMLKPDCRLPDGSQAGG